MSATLQPAFELLEGDPTGEEIFQAIMDSRLPIFQAVDLDNGRHYKVYRNGKIDGFGQGRVATYSSIEATIALLAAKDYSSNLDCEPSPMSNSASDESGFSHTSPK